MPESITVSSAPHISRPLSTRRVMIDVMIGLVPAMAAAGYFFRMDALRLIPTCVIACAATEWLCSAIRKKPNSLDDCSAVVTGIILALSLPPGLPVWAAVIGSCFAVAIGKMVFGGLGSNIFNPAMVGRAFLTASFGMMMTTWTVPATVGAAKAEIAVDNKIVGIAEDSPLHARTQATPLAWSKQAIKTARAEDASKRIKTSVTNDQLRAIFVGEVGGCLGETSALVLLIGGFYLIIRRTISLHIPLAVLLSAFVVATTVYLINPEANVWPITHLSSGGLMLGVFFIATDPVTAPLTKRGMWLFGIGVGMITMLIRVVGEYPEGVMYSVLLMNAATPLIDRFCKRVPAGGKPK